MKKEYQLARLYPNDYKKTLKKVGVGLIFIGLLDIVYMVYCIIHRINYSSSFNVFAVIAGIFLYKGGLKTASHVLWFSSFFLGGLGVGFLVSPFIIPSDLILAYLKIHTFYSIGSFFLVIALIIFLCWVYNELTSQDVLNAMDNAGINRSSFWKKTKTGFILGGCLPVLLGLVILSSKKTSSQTINIAISKAQKKVGNGYKFFVNSINVNSRMDKTYYKYSITAYNQNEIIKVPVEWEEKK